MKKHKLAKTLTLLFATSVLLIGCGKKDVEPSKESQSKEQTISEETNPTEANTEPSSQADAMKLSLPPSRQEPGETLDYGIPEEGVLRSMVLADADGNLYYIDVNTGTFFTAPIPEDLTDADGNSLSPDAIKAGSVVDIYGNGMMLESYPGQYPGVSKMVLIKEGTAQDAAPYQHLVDEITMPADPSEPPFMNAEYQTDLASVTVLLTRGNYNWKYIDEAGQPQNVIADGSHILAWPELNDITIDESIPNGLELNLISSRKPQSITVTRFPLDLWKKDASPESENTQEGEVSGEPVAVQEGQNGYTMTAEAGYVYLVEAQWEEGRVEFGFCTK
ncbi:MAG: hypothetical protein HFI63_04835 [Lachnospiraceae bacterium]|nr:hypothetical protein [Lachnospiraceae bacterium]